jgi:hypothetical protein
MAEANGWQRVSGSLQTSLSPRDAAVSPEQWVCRAVWTNMRTISHPERQHGKRRDHSWKSADVDRSRACLFDQAALL